LCRTTPSISHQFEALDMLINASFLPTLTDQTPNNNLLQNLLSLPIQEGRLGLVEQSKVASYHYQNSVKVTSPLVSILTDKSSTAVLVAHDTMMAIKQDVRNSNHTAVRDDIYKQLTTSLKKCVDIASEEGASFWFTALKHGYALHKRAFVNAIFFRYG